jgi:hypothetical protein
MLADVVAWTERYCTLPQAIKDVIENDFFWRSWTRFIVSANLSEGAGCSDIQSNYAIVQAPVSYLPATQRDRETRQLSIAMESMAALYTQTMRTSQLLTKWEALVLTPDSIQWVHRELMQGMLQRPGHFRGPGAKAAEISNCSGWHRLPEHDLVPSLMLFICNSYNRLLLTIPDDMAGAVPFLYNLAAVSAY